MPDKSKRKNSANASRNKILLVIALLLVSFISFYVGATVAINRGQADWEATRTAITENEILETVTREAELSLTTSATYPVTPTATWVPTLSQKIIEITATALADVYGTQYALTPTEQLPLTPTQEPICYFSWAYNDADAQDYADVQKLLSDAGFSNFDIKLPAHGEDHVCTLNDEIVSSRFGLMDISPQIILHVDTATLQDKAKLGAQAETIVDLLNNSDALPQMYQVTITFTVGDQTLTWSMAFNDATAAITAKIGAQEFWNLGMK